MKRKRNRELSKLIDFPNQDTKERAQITANRVGMNLKQWIESLIINALK